MAIGSPSRTNGRRQSGRVPVRSNRFGRVRSGSVESGPLRIVPAHHAELRAAAAAAMRTGTAGADARSTWAFARNTMAGLESRVDPQPVSYQRGFDIEHRWKIGSAPQTAQIACLHGNEGVGAELSS